MTGWGGRGEGAGSSNFPFVVTEIAREQLQQLNARKSTGPDGIHSGALTDLVGVIAGPCQQFTQGLGSMVRSLLSGS